MSPDPDPDPTSLSLDVALDLMPLYRAGSVRPGTRQAIRQYLAAHPEFDAIAMIASADDAPGAALERKSLHRTKRLLGLQRWMFGLAIACVALSLSTQVEWQGERVVHAQLLLFTHPLTVIFFIPAAMGFAAGYLYLGRRVAGEKQGALDLNQRRSSS